MNWTSNRTAMGQQYIIVKLSNHIVYNEIKMIDLLVLATHFDMFDFRPKRLSCDAKKHLISKIIFDQNIAVTMHFVR